MSGSHHSGRPAFIGARVYHSADQTIVHATETPLTFNSERYDTDGFHGAGAPTRLTIPAGLGGYYQVHGNVEFSDSGTSGIRQLLLVRNNAVAIANDKRALTGAGANFLSQSLLVNTVYKLVAGDFLTLHVEQTSGGAMDVIAGADYTPEFGLAFLGA